MTSRLRLPTCETVQKQLTKTGIRDFQVTQVAVPESDIRQFWADRFASLAEARPDAIILRSVRPALQRLEQIGPATPIFRWEADGELGKIVGYSTRQKIVAIYPWVMVGRDWVGSLLFT